MRAHLYHYSRLLRQRQASGGVPGRAWPRCSRRRTNVHVTPSRRAFGWGWQVIQGGRTLSHHHTRLTAFKVGRRNARRDHVELVTHGRNGRIRMKDSFGPESNKRG